MLAPLNFGAECTGRVKNGVGMNSNISFEGIDIANETKAGSYLFALVI